MVHFSVFIIDTSAPSLHICRKVLACVVCGRLKSAFQIASRSGSVADVQYVAHQVAFLSSAMLSFDLTISNLLKEIIHTDLITSFGLNFVFVILVMSAHCSYAVFISLYYPFCRHCMRMHFLCLICVNNGWLSICDLWLEEIRADPIQCWSAHIYCNTAVPRKFESHGA